VLPQQAVTRGTQGDTVIVVGADGKPAPRPVKIGSQVGNNWVVLEGLKEGEQVVVDGFQKMQAPGAPVKPVPWTQRRGRASRRRQPQIRTDTGFRHGPFLY
jgi:membrane fusion protein (multidrug efflux system)